MRRFSVLAFLGWVLLHVLAPGAAAHEMSIAEMDLREIRKGEFIWQWGASGNTPVGDSLRPNWPSHCTVEENLLKCGQQGLTGTLSIEGIGESYSAALVRVHWHDGVTRVHTITTSQPTARLFGSSVDNRTAFEIGGAYLVLGVEHILAGIDHLLFVIALLFLGGFNRQLVWTITAFTAAHSITLALSALDLLTLRSAPVEAAIALSIVLVAVEALHRRDTLSRRWPALVAFMFGLVHGLGFAGALREIGLPETHVSAALLAFNLGVEAGQLAVVGLALLAWWIGRRQPALLHARTPALYAIGALASWWSIDRSIAVFL